MARKVVAVVKLHIEAGKANPAPPIGPALAQHGVNLMQFCKEYNARTSNRIGDIIPAEISIYSDQLATGPPLLDLADRFAHSQDAGY